MDTGNSKGRVKSEINVTPLIDIVLVLLIVFIVMVPGLTKSLAVNIPMEKIPAQGPTPTPIVVTLNQQGKLLLQREEITLSSLVDRLAPVVQLQPMYDRKIFLKVDEEVLQQRIVQVLDHIRLASEKAKLETAVRMGNKESTGSEVKVAISLLKRV